MPPVGVHLGPCRLQRGTACIASRPPLFAVRPAGDGAPLASIFFPPTILARPWHSTPSSPLITAHCPLTLSRHLERPSSTWPGVLSLSDTPGLTQPATPSPRLRLDRRAAGCIISIQHCGRIPLGCGLTSLHPPSCSTLESKLAFLPIHILRSPPFSSAPIR